MEEEIWKTVILLDTGEIYDNYMVSNLGRVKSLNYRQTGEEKILKQNKNEYGYLEVSLSKNGKQKHFKTHRLVGFAFVEGYFEGAEIDHIYTNRENNIWTNLRWVTHEENCNNELSKEYRREIGLKPPVNYTKVICEETGIVYNTITEASEELGICYTGICSCCSGNRETAGDYHWYYFELDDEIFEDVDYDSPEIIYKDINIIFK